MRERDSRKLQNEEWNDLYSGNQIVKNEMGGACSMYGEGRIVYWVLVRKPEG